MSLLLTTSVQSRGMLLPAADITVSGQVTSQENGEPLPGVSVAVKGTSSGTLTDTEGRYTITVEENAVLVFSFLGFQSQEVGVAGNAVIDVTLVPDLDELERVVVVGYGTQKKASLTGSIVDVGGETLEKAPVASLSNSLAGRLPGVIGLNRSGQPGNNGSQILIRGSSTLGETSPLFVIDGVPGREGFDQIDPRDIESISVLKDASAAIYGARAANGVILITTKRGVSGKPTFRYSFNQGITQPTRLPEYADAATLAEFQNAQLVQGGGAPKFTEEEIQKFRDGSDPIRYPNTNWIESTLKDFSTQSRHSLSLRGGTEAVRYYLSGSYSNQDGMFRDGITNSKVVGTRSNIDANVTENIKLSLDLTLQEENNRYPSASADAIIEQMYRNYSYLADFYPNGLPGVGYSENRNPRLMVTDAHGYRNNKNNIYQTKASFDINIPQIEGLGADGFIAYDKTETRNKTFEKPAYTYRYDPATDEYIKTTAGQVLTPQLEERYDYSSNLILHAKIKYQRTFGDHLLNAFVAAEQAESKSSYFSAFRKDFLSAQVDQLFAGGAANQLTDGSAAEFNRRNYFGRISYEYGGKYLVDVNMRYDGSSAFPKENRWGFFPGVSAGWRISEEPFFRDALGWVTSLKIRGSWGQMGNDAIDPFQYLANYLLIPGYIFGETNRLNTGIEQGVEPNPNITWEVANTTNLGLDALLWDERVGVTFDIFKSRRSNILTQKNASVPIYTGLNLPLENIGVVENKGFELALNYNSRYAAGFRYSIGGNVALARNTVIDVDEPATVIEWQRATGHSMNTQLYYDAIGIYRTQEEIDNSVHPPGTIIGDLQYRDVDGNGQIDNNDRVRMDKTSTPEITFGLNADLRYRQFSLSILLQGQSRSWGYYYIPQGLFGNVLAEMVTNRPTPDNPNSKYPNLTFDESQVSAYVSDFWLINSSFLRLKTVELGYDLPAGFLAKVGIQNARIYLNGFNLLTFDRLDWFDPEGDEDRAANYPQNKIYNLGINVTF